MRPQALAPQPSAPRAPFAAPPVARRHVLPLALLLLLCACATIDSAPTPVKPAAKTSPKTTSAQPVPPVSVNAMKVGLLLPLSGARANLGQALQNAAQMAVFDDNGAQLDLMARDTGDTPEQAARAAEELLSKNVGLIVGPLFAQQVARVKPLAAARNVPLLALSNDMSLAARGTYLLGFAPGPQVARIADFACAQGSKRFVALLPSGGYGDVVNQALQLSVHRCSGASLAMRRYDAGTDQLARQLQETANAREQMDTLVLAEPLDSFKTSSLPTALDGRHIRLLGTSLWDDAQAGRVAPSLIGGWFAMPDGGDRARFERNYQAAYGAPPPRLAALAYDAVALAAALQKRNLPPDTANMTNPVGYMGVDGIFRLLPDGTVERGLSVNRIAANGREILDRAPVSFSPASH